MEAILVEKEGLFRAKAAGNLKPIPGAIGLIDELREYGVRVALGTSSPIENGQFVTRQLGIEDSFDAIVWGREVTVKAEPADFPARRRAIESCPEELRGY